MFSTPSTKLVRCYHCGDWVEVSSRALSISCPLCFQRLMLDDVIVRACHRGGQVSTCGKIIVHARGWLSASKIRASSGVTVLGRLDGDVTSLAEVAVGPQALWKGDLIAPSATVELGASVRGLWRIGAAEIIIPPSDAARAADAGRVMVAPRTAGVAATTSA